MKHDFPLEPEIRPEARVETGSSRILSPELVAITAIFVTLWVALGVHYLSGGTGW